MDSESLWERYMRVERRELADRRDGELAKIFGLLPGEPREELERVAREDQEKAEEDLVELRRGEEVWYKHIDDLTKEDRQRRIEAQSQRLRWIGERLGKPSSPTL